MTGADERTLIHVVGAVILRDGLVLCAQRGPGAAAGMWEFPGGKVEDGETPEVALRREIAEELGCDIAVGAHLVTARHATGQVIVELSTYACELTSGEPYPYEHAELAWLPISDLPGLAWAPADRPTLDLLRSQLDGPASLARG